MFLFGKKPQDDGQSPNGNDPADGSVVEDDQSALHEEDNDENTNLLGKKPAGAAGQQAKMTRDEAQKRRLLKEKAESDQLDVSVSMPIFCSSVDRDEAWGL